jgi:hypothetical protein
MFKIMEKGLGGVVKKQKKFIPHEPLGANFGRNTIIPNFTILRYSL